MKQKLFDVLQSQEIPISITFNELSELNKERNVRFNELSLVIINYIFNCKDDKNNKVYDTRFGFCELHNFILDKMMDGEEKYNDYVNNFNSYSKLLTENIINESLEDNSGETITVFTHYQYMPKWESIMHTWFDEKTNKYTNFNDFLQFADEYDKTFDDRYDEPFSEHLDGVIQYYIDEYNNSDEIFDVKNEIKERCIDRFNEYFCPLTLKLTEYHSKELKNIIFNIAYTMPEHCIITDCYFQ